MFSLSVGSFSQPHALLFRYVLTIRSYDTFLRYVSVSRASVGKPADDLLNHSSPPLGSSSGSCLRERSGKRHSRLPVWHRGMIQPAPGSASGSDQDERDRQPCRRTSRRKIRHRPGLAPASTGDSQLFKTVQSFSGLSNIQPSNIQPSNTQQILSGCKLALIASCRVGVQVGIRMLPNS